MPTLDFKGKQFIYGHHLTVPIRALEIDAEKSLNVNYPSSENLLKVHCDFYASQHGLQSAKKNDIIPS